MDQPRKPVNQRYIAFIELALQLLPPAEALKMRSRLREKLGAVQRAVDPSEAIKQYDHVVHELIVGSFIQGQGFTPCFEPALDDQTPDWLFKGTEGGASFFSEVANFQVDESVRWDMQKVLRTSYIWCGSLSDNGQRLYQTINTKAGKYKGVAESHDLPFVVFLYTYFDAFVSPAEVRRCLLDEEHGLFRGLPQGKWSRG
jgi:hypothetical protein